MRNAMSVLIALTLLLTGSFGFMHGYYLGVSDDVTVVQNTLYGDPAYAEGISLRVLNQYKNHLLWETSLTLGDDPVPKTYFTFQNEKLSFYKEAEPTGVSFGVSTDHVFAFDDEHLPEAAAEKYASLVKAYQELMESVSEGSSRTVGLDFSYYLDYYPLDGQILLPGYSTTFSEFEYWMSDSEEITKAINNYFKIPLEGGYSVDYQIDKTNSHSSRGAYINLDYHMNASGFTNDTACYFTFNTVKENGDVVDTGLIPGGYGIYCLPYSGSSLDFDALKMVYPLDPSESYRAMTLSPDGKRIRLETWQGNDLMLTVIDMETMTCLEKVKLFTQSEDVWTEIMTYDDFILIAEYGDAQSITLCEELSDGSWQRAFTVAMHREVFPEGRNLDLFDHYKNAVDYQDGRLVVLKHRGVYEVERWYQNYADIYVTVYDATGMVYAGTCEWNLTLVNGPGYSGKHIGPTGNLALEVSW